mgnify:CR=1 FL=1|jgi:ADP-ribose pyrophosphatase YjhB (NUDIX family)
MSWRDIRPVAVGVPERETNGEREVLLCRLRDEVAEETFYRPVGGGIEFGELSDDALVREFREELSVEVIEFDMLDTLENTFTFRGSEAHEIWFLYAVTLSEDWPYERESFRGVEDDGEPFPVEWVPVADLHESTVYPVELPALL